MVAPYDKLAARQLRAALSPASATLAILLLPACSSIALPHTIDPGLLPDHVSAKVGERCIKHINELGDDARTLVVTRDLLSVLGGGLAIAGGTSATIVEATSDKGSQSKAGVILSAGIAAAAGLVALVGHYVSDPSAILDKRERAARRLDRVLFNEAPAGMHDYFLSACATDSPPNQSFQDMELMHHANERL